MEEEAKKIQELETLRLEGENLVAAIRQKVEDIKVLSAEAEIIRGEVRSKRLAITQICTNADTRNTQIETAGANLLALEKSGRDIVQKISTENVTLSEYLTTFAALREKLDDVDDGLDATYVWAKQQKEEIGKLLGQARLDQAGVLEMKKSSQTDVNDIAKHKSDVEKYRKDIEKIYGYINGQGLAHSFTERQTQLKWPLIIWSIVLLASAILVSWALFRVFIELPIDSVTGKRIFDPASLFYRLSFVSPILLIFFVALSQYSRERKLLESYAFKAATAKALESYTSILSREFPEDKFRHRILAFVLHAMVGIYRHPNNELNKVEDDKEWTENLGELIGKAIKPFTEIADSAKEITSTVIKK